MQQDSNNYDHKHDPIHTGPGEVVCRICGEPCAFELHPKEVQKKQ